MGIHGLMKLIGDYAPSAVKDGQIKSYFGELVAHEMRAAGQLYCVLVCVCRSVCILQVVRWLWMPP